ncbi:site-specific DNA-methyltransferase [Cryobacterium sp. TMT1-21]|uniref:site-specific DNA-methyltransferase n=1 Tax=Cryobacterium sp. TMT1-21 TaxID=1259234 RepID=UPI001F542745|nr:site-specific DNA-methyltransferase [Cryobacterium sp. TMT1-21]
MTSPDLTECNIDKLAKLFPTVVTECVDADGNAKKSIDFDLLRQELSDHVVEGPQERYRLDWPGKRAAAFTANAPIAKTLRPVREESIDFDTTKNLFIEGDNLDVLKLLQESYLGKVKLIYIDPPYNTGNDFVYDDDFAESTLEYLRKSGQTDETGTNMVANTEANGRFHSDWLSMIYPRLKLARDLLASDGVIMISIDDNEVANLRKVADEVFGAGNFEASFVWQRKQSPQRDATNISATHDHILVYSKRHPSDRQDASGWLARLLPMGDEQLDRYKNPDDDPRGVWSSSDCTINKTAKERPNLYYPVRNPSTGEDVYPSQNRTWIFARSSMDRLVSENRLWWGERGTNFPRLKAFSSENQQGVRPQTLLLRTLVGDNQAATREVNALFPEGNVFDTAKPTSLIKHLCYVANVRDDDIVMDFFAGSGTTADAVMQLNAEDGEARRFVLVQLAEEYNENSLAHGLGFSTISETSRERVRRAGIGIVAKAGLHGANLDCGFRALRVDTSNMVDVLRTPETTGQLALDQLEESVKSGRSGEDLLFQVLLDWGLELTMPMIVEQINNCEVFIVEDGALIACFDEKLPPDLVREIAKRQPLRAVFRDSGFASDDARINAEQVFREVSPATDIKAI